MPVASAINVALNKMFKAAKDSVEEAATSSTTIRVAIARMMMVLNFFDDDVQMCIKTIFQEHRETFYQLCGKSLLPSSEHP